MRLPISYRFRRCFHDFKNHYSERIPGDHHFQLELLLITFASGIMDIVTFSEFRVFTYNQEANIILLGLRLFNIDTTIAGIDHIILSIMSYLSGITFPLLLGWGYGSNKRGWLVVLAVFQTGLVFGTAGLYERQQHPTTRDKDYQYGIITMLAFAAGSQVAFAWSVYSPDSWRSLVHASVDIEVGKSQNNSFCNRVGTVGFLACGILFGVIFYREISPMLALCLSGVVRVVVVFAIMAHPSMTEIDEGIELGALE